MIKIEQTAWGVNAASAEMIASRARNFGEGSIVVLEGERVVGYAAAQLTEHLSTGSWSEQTDGGLITRTHMPAGRLAYGVSMSALPGVGGKGVAWHVITHYARIFLETGRCDSMCVGSRLPGFARWSATPGNSGTLSDYLRSGTDARPRDPELRLYTANGFQILWGLPDYYPDPKSLDAGAMLLRRE
ncbi:GNAT family N-acetyltransferase [Breoghania sp. L-A4]|nr:GNAT family N-acetyltransferase [Breoghania sp. L-A4]